MPKIVKIAHDPVKQQITFSDFPLQNNKEGKKRRLVFIQAFVNPDSIMVFVAEKVKWSEELMENVTVSLEEITLNDFPAWYNAKLKDGWTYAP